MRRQLSLWLVLIVAVALLVVACAPKPVATPAPAATPLRAAPAPAATLAPAPPAASPTPAPAPVAAAPTPRPTTPAPTPAPATPAPAPAAKLPPLMSIATAGVGTTSYIVGSAFAEVLQKYTGTKLSIEPSGATARWIPLMKTKEIDLAIGCGFPDVQDGYYGKFFWADKGPQPVLHAATGHIMPFGFVVTDPKIKSLADLKGKKVYAEMKGMRIMSDSVKIMFREAGLKPGEVEVLTFADVNEATKGINEGKAIGVLYLPSVLPIVELDRAKPLYGVPVPKEIADKVLDELPVMGFTIWKKGEGIGKEDIPFITQPCGLHVRADLDQNVLYAFLDTVYSHYDDYKDKHPIMKSWTPQQGPSVIPLPLHPGSVKYFKDKGLWKAEYEKLQQRWLAQPRG